ncbi:MAG: hypothetical protein D8M58_00975 [Calditrichaeota bacterium]|nr:MAG: hypothetical protein DWQ03_06105 [Calditrichota bacterium]MBL1203940.1 hypothetical protein [Calditrichota bacterium]
MKINNLVDGITAYGNNWSYSYPNSKGSYTKYEYQTSSGLSLEKTSDTMDDVLRLYDAPWKKFTLNDDTTNEMYPRAFAYYKDSLGLSFTMHFYFVGTDTNDYQNKPITLISIW